VQSLATESAHNTGVKLDSTWRMKLKTRCVERTRLRKKMCKLITGKSMLNYALEMLDLNGPLIDKGSTMVAA
jgi:hypothetical protein